MQLNRLFPCVLIAGMIFSAWTSSLAAEGSSENDSKRFDVLNENVDNSGIITGSVNQPLTTGSIIRDSEMLSYCINISDVASEARNSILKKKLKSIEMDVDKKLVILTAKIEELQKWSKKRDEFVENVTNSLVKIFETMRPDAAALQFTEIGPVISSAIILKLDPKKSSAILTEMSPVDAAKVAIILTSALEVKNEKTN